MNVQIIVGILGSVMTGTICSLQLYFKTNSFEEEYSQKVEKIKTEYLNRLYKAIDVLVALRKKSEEDEKRRAKPDAFPVPLMDLEFPKIEKIRQECIEYERWTLTITNGKSALRNASKYGFLAFLSLAAIIFLYDILATQNVMSLILSFAIVFLILFVTRGVGEWLDYNKIVKEIDERCDDISLGKSGTW